VPRPIAGIRAPFASTMGVVMVITAPACFSSHRPGCDDPGEAPHPSISARAEKNQI
jgi:hypothetical protein